MPDITLLALTANVGRGILSSVVFAHSNKEQQIDKTEID